MQIYPQLERFIDCTTRDQQLYGSIKECVKVYSFPEGMGSRFIWAVYRIYNAVKAILGYSDWDRAEKNLAEGLACKESLVMAILGTQNGFAEQRGTAGKILEAFVLINENMHRTPNPENYLVEQAFRNFLRDANISSFKMHDFVWQPQA